jgi:death-on-curing protein
MKFPSIVYLNKEIVLEIHHLQLQEHGGAIGTRDHAGLESAIAQPQAAFNDEDLYPTVFDKAAAYAFFIAESQAFVDENERVALASALTFLALDGYEFPDDRPEFYDAMISISSKALNKEGLSNLFREAWISANIPKS